MRGIFRFGRDAGLGDSIEMNDGLGVIVEPLEGRLLLSGTHYVVDSLLDVVADDGVVTLREAIEAANTNTAVTGDVVAGSSVEKDLITFDQAALSAEAGVGVGEAVSIVLGGEELEITESLDIVGLGAEVLSVGGDKRSRVFYISGSGTNVELSGMAIMGGSIANSGGGIYNYRGVLSLTNTIVSGNRAMGTFSDGGGIFSYKGTLTLTNTTVSGNSAGNDGGGICNDDGELSLTNVTVSGNLSIGTGGYSSRGGGIYNDDGILLLTNTTVSGNLAAGTHSSGGGIYSDYSIFNKVTLNNTIVSLNEAVNGSDVTGRYSGSSILIGIDPEFVRNPSSGADGQWGTGDDDWGDLRLTDQSLAVGFGTNSLAVDHDGSLLAEDLDGDARIYGGRVDIGAYEYQGAASGGGEISSVVTTLVDVVDLTDGEVSLREAILYGHLLGETVTFSQGLSGGTILLEGMTLDIFWSVSIDGSSVGGMTVDAGGLSGVFSVNGDQTVADIRGVTMVGGVASGSGGGIAKQSGDLTLVDCMVLSNRATHYGGGIYNYKGTLSLVNTMVSGNLVEASQVYSRGGGIYNRGALTLANTTVSGNTAVTTGNYTSSGGGIHNMNGEMAMSNTTVSGNSANRGGGIFNSSKNLVMLDNSIVVFNEAVIDSDISGVLAGNNNLAGIDPGFVRNPSSGVDGEWGTEDDDWGDLHLTALSYAIDAGDNALSVDDDGQLLTVDLDGNARVVGGQVDIGAYEYQGILSPLREAPSSVVTTSGDVMDITDGEVSLREAILYGYLLGETVTFSPALSGGGIELGGSALEIYWSVSIDGFSVGGMTVDAGGLSRVFNILGKEANVELNGLTITGGYTTGNGGGIYNKGTLLTLINCKVQGNQGNAGGGIYNDNNTTDYDIHYSLQLINSVVSSNTAFDSGGGIHCHGKNMIVNSVISGNEAGNGGGGIYIGKLGRGSAVFVGYNSIVALNEASDSGRDIYVIDDNDSFSHSLIGIDPLFVRDADDGGDGWGDDPDTEGVDESLNNDYGDLRLSAGSLGIGAGDNGLLPMDEFDLDGDGDVEELLPVGLDGNARVVGGRVDIGAYESGYQLPEPNGDFNGDGVVGLIDLDIIGRNYGMESGASKVDGDANGDGKVGLIDLDILGRTWGMGAMSLEESVEVNGYSPSPQPSPGGRGGTPAVVVDWWEIELEDEEVVLF